MDFDLVVHIGIMDAICKDFFSKLAKKKENAGRGICSVLEKLRSSSFSLSAYFIFAFITKDRYGRVLLFVSDFCIGHVMRSFFEVTNGT